MSRYIDRDKFIERLRNRSIRGDCKFCNRFEECVKDNSRKGSHLNCWQMIDMPEANVVEVVRCKDCMWWEKQNDSLQGRCALLGSYPTGNWYCANGERKEC